MKKLICFTVLFFSIILHAQNKNLWKKSISNKISMSNEKLEFPQKQIFELDVESMKSLLKNSSNRETINRMSNTIISLPNVDGQLEQFRVYENSLMAPELASKFPEIKSYIGIGIENPTSRVYLSNSPLGFKAMTIYSEKEMVFIEPLNVNENLYTVYKTSDRKQAFTKFNCGVDNDTVEFNSNSSMISARGADDSKLRTFKLAVSCTGEYAAYFGGTKALALAAINNTLTRVNGIFERDFGVRLQLVANNDTILFTDATTDPFSTSTNLANELQTTLNNSIGDANFDLGHLFDPSNAGGNSGGIGSVGISNSKGRAYSSKSNPQGDLFDVQYVAHEMAHQLGAKHTFTYVTESSNAAQMEPGSGSTIMSYAGKTVKDIQSYYDSYFHAISIEQVTDKIKTLTCGTFVSTGNAVPVVNAGLDFTIPKGTPFVLTGSATDGNAEDVLTYTWEQMDLGNATVTVPTNTSTTGPLFRSYSPSNSATRYFPTMNTILSGLTSTAGYRIVSETLPMVARTMNFRLTVRDNRIGGGANNSDDMVITVDGVAGPFTVDSQNVSESYTAGTSQLVNWTVAGTNANGVNCANVDILLSTDGGLTYPVVLIAGTPNDGSQNITIPNLPGTTNRIMVKGSNHIFFDVNNANFTIISSGNLDTTAPTASVISASGTTTTSTNLSWTSSTDNVGVSGYKVYQNGILKTTTNSTTYTVTGLSASTSYNFYVIAFDATGNNSIASNVINVTTLTPVDVTAPSASVISASGTTTTTTNLSWTTSTDNVGVSGYKVYQNGVLKTTTTSNSLAVTNLSASTVYGFYVIAFDGAGNNSTTSNTINVTTLTPIDTTAPTASVLSASGTTVTSTNLTWTSATDNVGITGYRVYQNGALKTTTTSTSLSITNLSASTTYNFYVVAYDAAGNNSNMSNTVLVTTLAPALTYCSSNGTTTKEYINRVQLGSINNLSGNNNGYGNFTALTTNLTAGASSTITIVPAWNGAAVAEAYCVWIDYNKDGNFASNELVYSKAKTKLTTITGSFVVPTTALAGNTRMRVSMKYNGYPTACEVFANGEVEDYTVNIVNNVTVKSNETKEEVVVEKEEIQELSFKLYPNPVKDGIVYMSGVERNSTYKIYNQIGQQITSGNIEGDFINVSSLKSGVYMVEISNGTTIGMKRLIKE